MQIHTLNHVQKGSKRKRVDWHYCERLIEWITIGKLQLVMSFIACLLLFFPNLYVTNLISLPTESFWISKTKDNPNSYILLCFDKNKKKQETLNLTSFKERNRGQLPQAGQKLIFWVVWVKNIPISSVLPLRLVPVRGGFFEVSFGWKYEHGCRLLRLVTGASQLVTTLLLWLMILLADAAFISEL